MPETCDKARRGWWCIWSLNHGGMCSQLPIGVVEPARRVCIAHGSLAPCLTSGQHRLTSNPYWVKSVIDFRDSTIKDLTWEPAWEFAPHNEPAASAVADESGAGA